MLLHPEIQTRARKELDQVLGKGRLPEFSDRESLPYISAIVMEVLRSGLPLLDCMHNADSRAQVASSYTAG